MRQVAGRTYADTDGKNGGNFGAVVLDEEIVMIDAGIAHTITKITRDAISKQFGLPIRKVVFTHSHDDHVFGAQVFQNASIIGSIAMGESCRAALKQEWALLQIREYADQAKNQWPEYWASVQDLHIRTPDILFNDELVLGRADDIKVRPVGGHTADSSIVIVEPEHVCFSGDLLFCGRFPYAGDPTCNPDSWIRNLEALRDARYKRIIPGHGPVCGDEEVVRQLDFFRSLRSNIKRALKEGLSAEQFLERHMFPKYYPEAADRRVEGTIVRWHKFYAKG